MKIRTTYEAEIIWRQGFGFKNRDTQQAVTPETVFEAASLSKPVFAYLVLKLAENGVLGLNTPLSQYLPEPYLPGEPKLDLITARHVLSHTPGFPNWRPDGEALRIPLAPGARFSYSGEGFVYLQKVIEHLTARPLADLIRSNLLEPLGMARSSYTWLDLYAGHTAQAHNPDGVPAEKWQPWVANAAYSLHTTPSDFAQFMLTILEPVQAGRARLTPAPLAGMLSPQIQVNDDGASWAPGWPRDEIKLNDRLSWGLGWGLQHQPDGDAFWHWGDNGNGKAFAIGYPRQKSGLVLISNSYHGDKLWPPILAQVFPGEHAALQWIRELPD